MVSFQGRRNEMTLADGSNLGRYFRQRGGERPAVLHFGNELPHSTTATLEGVRMGAQSEHRSMANGLATARCWSPKAARPVAGGRSPFSPRLPDREHRVAPEEALPA